MRLSDFKVLSLDCYGTLIDWETGLLAALRPLLVLGQDDEEVLAAFGRLETQVQSAFPHLLYPDVLAQVYGLLADEFGVVVSEVDCARFGQSIGDWPAFADSAEALRYLKQHFKLVILSNVDRASFALSKARLGVEFDAIYTAQDIGSYKPSLRNFEYLIEGLSAGGVQKSEILHVAQSLFHDHVPAQEIGLASCWIDRRHHKAGFGATAAPASQALHRFRYLGLAELASAHAGENGSPAAS